MYELEIDKASPPSNSPFEISTSQPLETEPDPKQDEKKHGMVVESIPSITHYLKNGVENFEHMATSNFENVRKLIQFYLEQFRKRDQILDQINSATEEFEEKKEKPLSLFYRKPGQPNSNFC